MFFQSNKKGFTLIELLITVSIIAILFAVILVALNPLRLFAHSRNANRWISTSELLESIHLYIVQNKGDIPNDDVWQEDKFYMLGTDTVGCDLNCFASTEAACLNLSDLVTDKRIKQIPIDPKDGTAGKTRLYVQRESGSIITVGSCEIELEDHIVVYR